jgi:3-oxoacyl-[acyl-carrier protein] reductase
MEIGAGNKNIVITGCTSGIGFETLKILSKENYNIIACSRNFNEDFLSEINLIEKKEKNKIIKINLDLSNEESVTKAGKEILNLNLPISGLVNNAGVIANGLFQMTSSKVLKEVFQVNFFSQFLFTQYVIKSILKNKEQNKSIVNVASTSAFDKIVGRGVYSSSKAAIISLSMTLSKELSRYNIRVNTISPGITDTKMLHQNTDVEILKSTIKNLSIKRIANKNEIANVISFLLSEKASYITGQNIRIDGGL